MKVLKVLMVPVLAATLASSACDLVTANLRAEQTAQWQKSYPIAANGSLDIENVNGKIDVEPSSGATIEVTAVKKARGASDEAAKAALDRITIAEDVSGDHVRIEAKFPQGGGMFTASGNDTVEFHVKVPAGLTAKFVTVNGGVEISGLSGRVTAETTNGGVTAHDISGQLDASSTNGGLEIDLAKMADGGVKLECTNGGITVHLPRDAKATISASITNGGIGTSDLPIEKSGEDNRRKLDAKMNGGGPRLQIDGTNGGIKLTSR
jgi:DUF4097 and DUF4098 domain-containing protein YvlB